MGNIQYKVGYTILQLNEDCDNRKNLLFESLKMLKRMGLAVERNNYKVVYSGTEGYTGCISDEAVLDGLFYTFNNAHPKDFKGHSLSVSDVVILETPDGTSSYYCDSFGWSTIPDFKCENDVKSA